MGCQKVRCVWCGQLCTALHQSPDGEPCCEYCRHKAHLTCHRCGASYDGCTDQNRLCVDCALDDIDRLQEMLTEGR